MPLNVHEHLELSLYIVETAAYPSLHLIDIEYPHWIISYVLSGDLLTGSGGEHWEVHAGDVMVHPPNVSFSEIAVGGGTHQWIMFDMTTANKIDLFRLYPVAPVVTLQRSAYFEAVFESLLQVWKESQSPFRSLETTALAIQLCGVVLESWRSAGSVVRPDVLMTPRDRFIEVITYMSEHLEQKLSRDELAALVYLHPGYFDRVFQRIYGIAPMQMLRDLRLQRALTLLEMTNDPLSAIAVKCGLGEAGYFSRVFRQRYGQTPGQYRQSVKNTMKSYIPPL